MGYRDFLRITSVALVMLSVACATDDAAHEVIPDPGTYRNGLVVSAHELASQVGIDVMRNGGNAVDAAVATFYALAVVLPSAGNIGGGGFMVIRTPDGESFAIDFREQAPGRAYRDMFLDENGDFVQDLTRVGALAAGVPGSVAGTLHALELHGTMNREEVIRPAIGLARDGWVLNQDMGGERFAQFPSSQAVFNKPDGTRYLTGEVWAQPDLAETLGAIAEEGRSGFYGGWVADRIVETMEAHGGLISHEDLRGYEVKERVPLQGSYRGYDIVSMPPVSSGGITLIGALNILERYDLAGMQQGQGETLHLMAEAMRRSFADRNWYIADPDFVDVPRDVLVSKEYGDHRASDIDPERATPSDQITHGDVDVAVSESNETTHFSVVDGDGMAVSVTTTINSAYGSLLVVDGAGFLLNNQMGDFSARAGVPNHSGHVYSDANSIEPGKRMISSQTPTIVAKDGKNFLVVGGDGSGRIITAVLQTIVNVIDHGMGIEDAVIAPRIHHQWLPDHIEYEEESGGGVPPAALVQLEAMGHTLIARRHGNIHALMIDPETGWFTGIAEPRRNPSGKAVGY
jgi:gamma-glutamyltranspeptidase/glutathione hydrolase